MEKDYKQQKEQDTRKRLRKKQIRQRRERMRRLVCATIFLCVGLCSFLLGNCVIEKIQERDNSVKEAGGAADNAMDGETVEQDKTEEQEESGLRDESESDLSDEDPLLILVNKENPLPDNYEVELITLPDGTSRAASQAYGPLMKMLQAGKKAGLNFVVCSSYRDVEYQKKLFEEDVKALMRQGYSYQRAYEEVAKETMPPGCSEHSTGLAFDIVSLDYQLLDSGQERTAENRWLQAHCAEYGFILRYPQGKEEITQISYESWHFRYVGKEAAEYIMEKGITLEEYLEEWE